MTRQHTTGQHPGWCDLPATCDRPDDGVHVGHQTVTWPRHDDARLTVGHSEDVLAGQDHSETVVRLDVWNSVGAVDVQADTHLSLEEAEQLAATLTQAVRLARHTSWHDRDDVARPPLD